MQDALSIQHMKEIDAHLRRGQLAQAQALCASVASGGKTSLPTQLMLSQALQRMGDFAAMLSHAEAAAALDPGHIGARLRVIESVIYCCDVGRALRELAALEAEAQDDPRLLQELAQLYLHCAGHAQAARCHQRGADLMPDDPHYLFNLAASCVTLGEVERAEQLLTRVIALNPADAGAYLNRSVLRTWSAKDNHVDQLQRALARLPERHAAEVPLCYALAKELEDLGEPVRSFHYLERGARQRRAMLGYQVETDVNAMAAIATTFDRTLLAKAAPPRLDEPSMFVLGLPRSGTTLVERILSSHSQVGSLGEINDFAFLLMRLAAGPGGKQGMISRSAGIDFAQLGALYRAALAGYGNPAPHLINKMPANFLYLGLIRLALPGAKAVHLRRHPLDSCYAMYKTLFRMGYPFSYSLADLGHYYLAYHRLMAHWRDLIPDAFVEADYDSLTANQEADSRAMLGALGLPWEAACLDFHTNAAPSATASAAQVRRPMYRSSVQRWRQFEQQLAPLADFLSANGIDCS